MNKIDKTETSRAWPIWPPSGEHSNMQRIVVSLGDMDGTELENKLECLHDRVCEQFECTFEAYWWVVDETIRAIDPIKWDVSTFADGYYIAYANMWLSDCIRISSIACNAPGRFGIPESWSDFIVLDFLTVSDAVKFKLVAADIL
jgi:hypothetical protein